jgi:hypothetical protein
VHHLRCDAAALTAFEADQAVAFHHPQRTRQPATPRPGAQRVRSKVAPDLVTLPTPEEIAALLCRKPVGALIADICRDLGITPGVVGRELWDELHCAIIGYGGSVGRYFADMSDRLFPVPNRLPICPLPLREESKHFNHPQPSHSRSPPARPEPHRHQA